MSRKARSSRLSLQTQLSQLKKENEEFRDALETIADVLEDVGILDSDEEDDEVEPEDPSEEEILSFVPAPADPPDETNLPLPTKESEDQ